MDQQNNRPKVLVTGASGLIGGMVIRDLADKYEFSGLSRRPVEGIPHTQADIANLDAIRPAFQGMDMVVHMSAETKDLDNWNKIIDNSIVGTVNVFRAAQEAGVKRVVFGSSGGTMCGHERNESLPYGKLAAGRYDEVQAPWPLLDHNDVPRADAPYAIAKLFGENTARWFSDVYGMSMLCIRLGAVLDTDAPKLLRHFPGFLSQSDCVQIVDKSLAAPMSLKWAVYDAISENQYRWRDTTYAKEVLGWQPTGTADIYNPDDYR
jgi:NAD+ dependent glucose-6-phosphate dehydrogenase